MTVAFAGLGAMGYPMAGRVASRFPTLVWNRTGSVAQRHVAEFGSRAVALDAFADADVVVSCLASSDVVGAVVDEVLPQLRAGTVWVDCTSGQPAQSRLIAERLGAAGVDYLDAPVSGMAAGARAGTLTAMVGGPVPALERARPVLAAMCANVVHVGGVGSGHLVKAANNTMFAGTFWLAAELVARLADAGIDPQRALECVNLSSGRSFVTERFLPDYVLPEAAPSSYRLGQSAHDVAILVAATDPGGAAAGGQLVDQLAALYADAAGRIGADSDAAPAFRAIGRR